MKLKFSFKKLFIKTNIPPLVSEGAGIVPLGGLILMFKIWVLNELAKTAKKIA